MAELRPFWRYYGGKWSIANTYPAPRFDTVIEPFAGAAGFALRHYQRQIMLVEEYPPIAEAWRYLIGTRGEEIRAIPIVESIDELPASTPEGARLIVGLQMNTGTVGPRRTLSRGLQDLRAKGRPIYGWSPRMRERIARQADAIKHWRVTEGDYRRAPDIEATWYIDAPYFGRAGSHYPHGSKRIDYMALAAWCRSRRGQVIVCEAAGATWLPFRVHVALSGMGGRRSREGIWTSDPVPQLDMFTAVQ